MLCKRPLYGFSPRMSMSNDLDARNYRGLFQYITNHGRNNITEDDILHQNRSIVFTYVDKFQKKFGEKAFEIVQEEAFSSLSDGDVRKKYNL